MHKTLTNVSVLCIPKTLVQSLNTDLLIVTFIFQSKKYLFTYNLNFNTVATRTSAAIAQSVYSLMPALVVWSFIYFLLKSHRVIKTTLS
jgi:hypothetical protein